MKWRPVLDHVLFEAMDRRSIVVYKLVGEVLALVPKVLIRTWPVVDLVEGIRLLVIDQ